MKNILLASCLGLSSLILSACGGGSGTCGNTAACGGDIVGTWKITSSCVSESVSMMDTAGAACAGETVDSSSLSITGTSTFNADLTYTNVGVVNGSVVETIPASCLTFQGQTLTCAQLSQAAAATGTGFSSFTCVGTSSCTCTIVLSDEPSNETGTYTVTAAGVLTTTPTGGSGTPEQDDYCVKGTTLTESPHGSSASMMGASVSGTITFAKQ